MEIEKKPSTNEETYRIYNYFNAFIIILKSIQVYYYPPFLS